MSLSRNARHASSPRRPSPAEGPLPGWRASPFTERRERVICVVDGVELVARSPVDRTPAAIAAALDIARVLMDEELGITNA